MGTAAKVGSAAGDVAGSGLPESTIIIILVVIAVLAVIALIFWAMKKRGNTETRSEVVERRERLYDSLQKRSAAQKRSAPGNGGSYPVAWYDPMVEPDEEDFRRRSLHPQPRFNPMVATDDAAVRHDSSYRGSRFHRMAVDEESYLPRYTRVDNPASHHRGDSYEASYDQQTDRSRLLGSEATDQGGLQVPSPVTLPSSPRDRTGGSHSRQPSRESNNLR